MTPRSGTLLPDDTYTAQLHLAHERLRLAYQQARRLVWDRLPAGAGQAPHLLEPQQRAALAEFADAEAWEDRLRRRWHVLDLAGHERNGRPGPADSGPARFLSGQQGQRGG